MLEAYKVGGTHKLPEVVLDPRQGVFQLWGRSIPEDASQFYRPLLAWLDTYAQAPNPDTHFHFKLEYFNTASGKYLLEICRVLEHIYTQSLGNVLITWEYEHNDTTIEESGDDFRSLIRAPFEMVARDAHSGQVVEHHLPDWPAQQPLRDTGRRMTATAVAEMDPLVGINTRLQQELSSQNERLMQALEDGRALALKHHEQSLKVQGLQTSVTALKHARTATTIAAAAVIGLLLVSELVELLYIWQAKTPLSFGWVLAMKLGVTLLFKPIESATFRRLDAESRLR